MPRMTETAGNATSPIAAGHFRPPRLRLDHQRTSPWRGVAISRRRPPAHIPDRAHPAQDARRRPRLRSDQRRRRCDRRRQQSRHLLRLRLSRRRPAALRSQGAGRRVRAGAASPADRPADERAHDAAVSLEHPAADRARLFLAARTHAQGRGRRRPVDRREHLSRHGRGSALHPPLPREPHAQRAVHGDDRRHGRHRRDRAGDLRDHARPAHPRRRRTFRDRLGDGRAGGEFWSA